MILANLKFEEEPDTLIQTLTSEEAEFMDADEESSKIGSDYVLWQLGIPTYEDDLSA